MGETNLLEGEIAEEQGVDPTVLPEDQELEEQNLRLNELLQLLEEPVPKDEEKFTQSQLALKTGIPRSTLPRFIELYENITEPGMRFIIRTKSNTVITERGCRFFTLIRKLREEHNLSHEYLQEFVEGVIKDRPLTPTLNKADAQLIYNLVRKIMQGYTDNANASAAIRERDEIIERLSKENAEMRKIYQQLADREKNYQKLIAQKETQSQESYSTLIEESRRQSLELEAQNRNCRELLQQNKELMEQNKQLAMQVRELLERDRGSSDNSESEKKGFFSRFFGL